MSIIIIIIIMAMVNNYWSIKPKWENFFKKNEIITSTTIDYYYDHHWWQSIDIMNVSTILMIRCNKTIKKQQQHRNNNNHHQTHTLVTKWRRKKICKSCYVQQANKRKKKFKIFFIVIGLCAMQCMCLIIITVFQGIYIENPYSVIQLSLQKKKKIQ